jgi:hypothetical protein
MGIIGCGQCAKMAVPWVSVSPVCRSFLQVVSVSCQRHGHALHMCNHEVHKCLQQLVLLSLLLGHRS